jgi:hypothetical protein
MKEMNMVEKKKNLNKINYGSNKMPLHFNYSFTLPLAF